MTALYKQVSDDILTLIQSGRLAIGDRLPPEADYAAELGVSRSTLRLAFAELERMGVLLRKKRAGTRIISDQPKPQFNMSTSGLHDLLSLGRDTELVISGTRTVQTDEISHLEGHLSETGHWLEISGTRTLPGQSIPFNTTKIYVPARFAGIEHVLKDHETSVFKVIEETFDVAVGRVSQAAKAIACPAEAATVIDLEPGAAALQIVADLATRSGDLMEVSVAIFDPNRFELRTDVEIE